MNIIIFLQRSEYNFERDEYFKNKTNFSLPSQYSMSFPGKYAEAVYIIASIKLHIGKNMYGGHYVCDVLYYSKRTWWNCDDGTSQ